jgi:hypothetical protein
VTKKYSNKFYSKTYNLHSNSSWRSEITGEWRKLRNEEPNDLYCSPNNFWVIKSRRMGWAEHVVRIEERSIQGFGVET